jgi:CheY-like chemotaxis protein
VQASESRLGQVFLNLVVNAAQAIEEGHADENEIRVSTSIDAMGRVAIEITDTGSGMPAEVLERLFTPFFTTKAVGVGTGLGLSICHRIVTGFGGNIEVHSTLGKGTTFRVFLPVAAGEVSAEKSEARVERRAQKRGRVLVVDDEPMIARLVQRTLSDEHEIIASERAAEALDRINSGERFDVILCDVMMPQMTGIELHGEICKVERVQAERMVFLTGGTFTAAAREFLEKIANPTVEKPFDTQHLKALINERIK